MSAITPISSRIPQIVTDQGLGGVKDPLGVPLRSTISAMPPSLLTEAQCFPEKPFPGSLPNVIQDLIVGYMELGTKETTPLEVYQKYEKDTKGTSLEKFQIQESFLPKAMAVSQAETRSLAYISWNLEFLSKDLSYEHESYGVPDLGNHIFDVPELKSKYSLEDRKRHVELIERRGVLRCYWRLFDDSPDLQKALTSLAAEKLSDSALIERIKAAFLAEKGKFNISSENVCRALNEALRFNYAFATEEMMQFIEDNQIRIADVDWDGFLGQIFEERDDGGLYFSTIKPLLLKTKESKINQDRLPELAGEILCSVACGNYIELSAFPEVFERTLQFIKEQKIPILPLAIAKSIEAVSESLEQTSEWAARVCNTLLHFAEENKMNLSPHLPILVTALGGFAHYGFLSAFMDLLSYIGQHGLTLTKTHFGKVCRMAVKNNKFATLLHFQRAKEMNVFKVNE